MKRPPAISPHVPLRRARERLLQTLLFEAGGLLLVTPLLAWASGAQAGESLALLVALSVAVMVWAALYNTAFDHLEARFAQRVASARPHRLRLVHALGLDVVLGAVYAANGYAYHWLFDRLRPVRD